MPDEQKPNVPPISQILVSTQKEHFLDPKQETNVQPDDQPQIGIDTNGGDSTHKNDDSADEQAGVEEGGAPFQTDINQYKDYDLFLIAGIRATGKNYLLNAFYQTQNAALNPVVLTPTVHYKIEINTINRNFVGRKKAAFVNAAGEMFELMHPEFKASKSIAETDLEILTRLDPKNSLRGLILLFDLKGYWENINVREEEQSHEQKRLSGQIEIVKWILALLRWFFYGNKHNQAGELKTHIINDINQMDINKTRLNIPVQVLFSKADELHGFSVPGYEHKLRPRKESPFFMAYHYLPKLHDTLLHHANYFRYDFVRSALLDPDTGVDKIHPCGVEESFKWLLTPQSRFRLSTQRLIQIQRALDTVSGRGARWERYPIPN